MDKLLLYLDSVHHLSPALHKHLNATVRKNSLHKKQFLLMPGNTCRNMCFISSGLLRAFYMQGDNEVSSWFMKEGDVCVSIESFYAQKPGYEYIQAIEDTEYFYIDQCELENIYKTYPEFNVVGRVLTIKYLNLWAQQLYAIRMQSAPERYEWLLRYHPELLLRVPHKYIASYLDITPVTLSKIRNKNF